MAKNITSKDIRNLVETVVADYPAATGQRNLWKSPLLVTAKADRRFDILPQIASPEHVLPKDLLSTARSVIVLFVPFIKQVAAENHKGDIPCRSWGMAYESTNTLINSLTGQIKQFIADAGYTSALVPATHNFDHEKLMARWSHKHLGYIAGLGRFGVNAQFITPSGCAGRLGSLVTQAELEDSPLVMEEELCRHKNGHKCLVCVRRCPVNAVSVHRGIDRKKCWTRLKANIKETQELKGLKETTHVCGKCQVVVPCSFRIPRG